MTPEEAVNTLKLIAEVIAALTAIIGVPFGTYRCFAKIKQLIEAKKAAIVEKANNERKTKEREERQDQDIETLKKENCLVMYGLSACLDGLLQLNCNHSVPDAKKKLDKYLNEQAHK